MNQESPRLHDIKSDMDDANTFSIGAWDAQDPLVKFGVDMSELSNYLDNIIVTVN